MDRQSLMAAKMSVFRGGHRIVSTDQYLTAAEYTSLWQGRTSDADQEWSSVAPADGRKARTFVVIPENPAHINLGDSMSVSDSGRWFERRFRTYNPFEEAFGALHRVFAGSQMTPAGVLEFADRFGLLFSDSPDLSPRGYVVASGERAPNAAWIGEWVDDWYAEVKAMRNLVHLWDLLRRRDDAEIAKYFRVSTKDGQMGIDSLLSYLPEDRDRRYTVEPDKRLPVELAQIMAQTYIADVANTRLMNTINPELRLDDRGMCVRLSYLPTSLMAALWFQYAVSVDGAKGYERCAACGTWFEVSPDVARTNRAYCSDACRSRAYRMRKAEAGTLASGGMSVDDIAKRLKTRSATVRRWLASESEENVNGKTTRP